MIASRCVREKRTARPMCVQGTSRRCAAFFSQEYDTHRTSAASSVVSSRSGFNPTFDGFIALSQHATPGVLELGNDPGCRYSQRLSSHGLCRTVHQVFQRPSLEPFESQPTRFAGPATDRCRQENLGDTRH